MNKNEKFVITINRELGSGGGSVGRKLAERLDVKFINKALLQALKEQFHLSLEELEKLKGAKDGWWVELQRRVIPFADKSNDAPADLITTEDVFNTETKVLKNLAEKESCVFVGRSAFYVLRNHPNHLSVFIQAPMEQRIQRVMEKNKLSRDLATKLIQKIDERRENYVNKFAKTSRYDTRNYDLVINMDHLKTDDAVEMILDYIFRQSL